MKTTVPFPSAFQLEEDCKLSLSTSTSIAKLQISS